MKNLFGGGRPAAPNRQPQAAPNRGQRTGNNPIARPSNRSALILSRREEIPHHYAVLSATGAALELHPDLQKSFAILLVDRDKKKVEIVRSTELIKSSVNDDLLTIADTIRRAGYERVRNWNAKPELISIIYESSESQKSVQEQERAASKIQMEFDELLVEAQNGDVSDIHIEVRRDVALVRFRSNGNMYEHREWPVRYARTMAGVIYQVIAEEKDTTFDEMKPQDAIIERDLAEHGKLRVRLATLPAYPSGFDMIMRLLKMGATGQRRSLESLGYNQAQLSKVRRAVAKPVGGVFMAGTTGSGKSTSLNSMMAEKIDAYKGRIKVITIEDPPEYLLSGSTQVPVVRSRSAAKNTDKTANPFTQYARAAMRSDPDVMMVGEVRDESTAELLIHAIQSGHQVFTTVHASSALEIVSRLRSNGVPDDVLGSQSFFSALMYQTLLPVVCKHCSFGVADFAGTVQTEQEYEMLGRIYRYMRPSEVHQLRFTNTTGCKHCEGGIVGRTVAAEVILPDPYILQCFRDRREGDALCYYRDKGGKISLDHGLLKALQGQCDLRDVEHKLDQVTALEELEYAVQVFKDIKSPTTAHFKINQELLVEGELDVSKEKQVERRKAFMDNFLDFLSQSDEEPVIDSESAPIQIIDPEKEVSAQQESMQVSAAVEHLEVTGDASEEIASSAECEAIDPAAFVEAAEADELIASDGDEVSESSDQAKEEHVDSGEENPDENEDLDVSEPHLSPADEVNAVDETALKTDGAELEVDQKPDDALPSDIETEAEIEPIQETEPDLEEQLETRLAFKPEQVIEIGSEHDADTKAGIEPEPISEEKREPDTEQEEASDVVAALQTEADTDDAESELMPEVEVEPVSGNEEETEATSEHAIDPMSEKEGQQADEQDTDQAKELSPYSDPVAEVEAETDSMPSHKSEAESEPEPGIDVDFALESTLESKTENESEEKVRAQEERLTAEESPEPEVAKEPESLPEIDLASQPEAEPLVVNESPDPACLPDQGDDKAVEVTTGEKAENLNPDVLLTQLVRTVGEALQEELIRNGFEMTDRFLFARMSTNALKSMAKKTTTGDEAKKIINDFLALDECIELLQTQSRAQLFSRLESESGEPEASNITDFTEATEPAEKMDEESGITDNSKNDVVKEKPAYKSKLLGGNQKSATAKNGGKPNVKSLNEARARRNKSTKKDNEDDS